MSNYSNSNQMEYAQTEYQQCNMKLLDNNPDVYGNNNYYTQEPETIQIPKRNITLQQHPPQYNNNEYQQQQQQQQQRMGYSERSARPVRRPAPPINNGQNISNVLNQPRPSPQVRPVALNQIRSSPQIRPTNMNQTRVQMRNNTVTSQLQGRASPQIRPMGSIPPPPQQQPRPSAQMRSNSSPQLRPMASIPPPPQQPRPSAQIRTGSPQIRPIHSQRKYQQLNETSSDVNSPKLPLRSQSSMANLQKLKNSKVEDPVIPPRHKEYNKRTRGSVSSQGSASEYPVNDLPHTHRSSANSGNDVPKEVDNNQSYNTISSNMSSVTTATTTNTISANTNNTYNSGYYENNNVNNQGFSNPTSQQTIQKQPTMQPQTSYPQPQLQPHQPQSVNSYSSNYNSNMPLNYQQPMMYHGQGQYRIPTQPPNKNNGFGGKLPMTSLGGQPMPFGQSLEMYRQNAKRSNDPHVQLEFAKYLISTADAAMDSDPDKKIAQKNQEILYNEGLKWIKKLASQGGGLGKQPYAEAQFFLAECYGNGSLGLQIDHEKAFQYYLQASKQSHPPSTYRAAVCYEYGAGTKKDNQRAVQFYRKAAALGDVISMYKLGKILLDGLLNQTKNPREGLTWLKRAAAQADQNYPHALHELGLIYEGKNSETNGLIIPDLAYSHELYLKAAQFGYPPSQFKLGLCYEYGLLNLPIDSRRSIAWYSKAAEQGDPEAELALSGWYLTGAENVLAQSNQEAYLWARKSANKGLAKAEYAVGYYLENGIGVKANLEDAKRFYLSAASQNNKRAIIRLKELKAGNINSGLIQGWREQSQRTGSANEECIIS